MKTNTIFILVFVVILALLGFLLYRSTRTNTVSGQEMIPFAQCLASKNVTMYGAYWCQHCKNDKAKFGDAFKYVPYVECTQDVKKCTDAGVQGYPTWIVNGKKLEGEQGVDGFATLASASSCSLPQPTTK